MGAMQDIASLLVNTIFQLFLLALILRLLLQLARADFYNPISQFVVKVTGPLLNPLRRIIPGIGGIDLASIVLILLTQVAATAILIIIRGFAIPNPILLLIWGILGVLGLLINIYYFLIIAAIIVSWVAPGSYHPAVLLLSQLTEPVMRPFRSLLPPIGGLDLSPILLFLVLRVLEILLGHLSAAVGLPAAFVIGI